MKERSQLKILLLQAREDQETRQEELDEFVRLSRLQPEQFTILDVFATPQFSVDCLAGHDALFVGGSSDASVLNPVRFGFVEDAKRLMGYCVDQEVPVFASCFGFQVVVEALGGQVILDKAAMEIGALPMKLTAAAREDPLFHDLPDQFMAIVGHKERAVQLPEGAIHLAGTELCPYHALKIPGKPFYGFQFHPEMNHTDLIARFTRYRDRYLDQDDDLENLDEILGSFQETPEANQLIEKFIERILLPAQSGR
jgi:GMP synthase (glutamine-hydrolysing)